jgi:hypothetical protein
MPWTGTPEGTKPILKQGFWGGVYLGVRDSVQTRTKRRRRRTTTTRRTRTRAKTIRTRTKTKTRRMIFAYVIDW